MKRQNIEIRCICCGKLLNVVKNAASTKLMESTCSRCKSTNTFITRPKGIPLETFLKDLLKSLT